MLRADSSSDSDSDGASDYDKQFSSAQGSDQDSESETQSEDEEEEHDEELPDPGPASSYHRYSCDCFCKQCRYKERENEIECSGDPPEKHRLLIYAINHTKDGSAEDEYLTEARDRLRKAHLSALDKDPPIVVAAREGNTRVVEAMIKLGVPVDQCAQFTPEDDWDASEMETALFAACKENHADCFEWLVRNGAETDWCRAYLPGSGEVSLKELLKTRPNLQAIVDRYEFERAQDYANNQLEKVNRGEKVLLPSYAFGNLGDMYRAGKGTAVHRGNAARWFIRAAEMDDSAHKEGMMPKSVAKLRELADEGIKTASDWLEKRLPVIEEKIRKHDERVAMKQARRDAEAAEKIKQIQLEKERREKLEEERVDRRAKEVERCRAVALKLHGDSTKWPKSGICRKNINHKQDHCTYFHKDADLPPHCRWFPDCRFGDNCHFNHLLASDKTDTMEELLSKLVDLFYPE